MLVALKSGLAPHAEALDCEDIRGPRSLFGESAGMPRPLGPWNPRKVNPACGLNPSYDSCCVLWECDESVSPVARAARIFTGAEQPEKNTADDCDKRDVSGCALDVPALTYIAGSSTSSFAVAWELLGDDLLPEWGAVLCARQTRGRGQLRRTWHSPRGNLYVTFRLPDAPALRGDAASLVTGWLLAKAFRELGFPLTLKWPNDLMLNERSKVGGLLLEEKNGVILAGLGVNLAEAPSARQLREDHAVTAAILFPPLPDEKDPYRSGPESAGQFAARPAGITCASEEPLAPFPLWRLLVSQVILEYSRSVTNNGFSELLGRMDEVLAWRGRDVVLQETDGSTRAGRFLGLGPGGGLVLRTGHGEEREFFSGSLLLSH